MDWTNDEIKRMKEMREEGLTVKAIAEALGRSIPSVSGKVTDLGLGKMFFDKPCERCGKMLYHVPTAKKYCAECRKEMDRLNTNKFYSTHTAECVCARCGKTFRSKNKNKYCGNACILAARKDEAKKRKVPDRNGKIDIEIKVLGELKERKENISFAEARNIYRKGYNSRNYCTVVYVDGIKIETIPMLFKFFDFNGGDF